MYVNIIEIKKVDHFVGLSHIPQIIEEEKPFSLKFWIQKMSFLFKKPWMTHDLSDWKQT